MGLRPHLVRHAHPACVDLFFAWTLDRVIASFAPGRFDYSNDCAHYLGNFHPELTAFTETCAERHSRMVVYDVDSTLAEHGHDDHHFVAGQGLAYKVTETPAAVGGPERTEMELEAEGMHPLAQQQDVTKQGDGSHEVTMLLRLRLMRLVMLVLLMVLLMLLLMLLLLLLLIRLMVLFMTFLV